jgi:hypothetical protein
MKSRRALSEMSHADGNVCIPQLLVARAHRDWAGFSIEWPSTGNDQHRNVRPVASFPVSDQYEYTCPGRLRIE